MYIRLVANYIAQNKDLINVGSIVIEGKKKKGK
jgi:hypothetical protein